MGSQRVRHDWATFTFTLKTFYKTTVVAFMTLWYWYKHKLYTESPSSSFPGFARHSLESNELDLEFLILPVVVTFSSFHFSCSVTSNSLWPHGLQHTRLLCPLPIPRAYSNSCPSPWWCHPTISPSVAPFSSCLQSFPASGSFPMSWFFASGGQSTGVSIVVALGQSFNISKLVFHLYIGFDNNSNIIIKIK